MLDAMFAVLLAVVAGFVVAGISTSAYALATDGRLRFESRSDDPVGRSLQIALLTMAGPLIIVRNCWRGVLTGDRPFYWLALSVALASAWSFCLGLVLLNLVAALG